MAYEIITKQQDEMIGMLIEGESISDIARKLGVTRNTIYVWKEKEVVKAELDKQKHLLVNQGNDVILKDLITYIGTIKELAKDKSDKRVCLAANQYLINRIYGNPTTLLEVNESENTDNMSETELENEINKFKKLKAVK